MTANAKCSCAATLSVASILLEVGLGEGTDRSFSHLWKMGYGTVTSESIINWNLRGSGGLVSSVIIVNLPQAILSLLFLVYNAIFTCILLADE